MYSSQDLERFYVEYQSEWVPPRDDDARVLRPEPRPLQSDGELCMQHPQEDSEDIGYPLRNE